MPNLVGIGLSQVPTNSMLGGLAYQDPEHASIKDLDLKNISQINSEISDTATDIFVYDTRKDSDGGAWRKRTQHTSWYNETLGTAVRGTRREFPAVAVIVATSSGVTIYDGDEPDLPMWMVFEDTATDMINTHNVFPDSFSLSALNANVLVGDFNANYGEANVINFISDSGVSYYSAHSGDYKGNISQRNDGLSQTINSNYGTLSYSVVNDVAMTVLPNAPIDDATGLPVPTIAVAVGKPGTANGGVSVIKDDGSVVDIIAAGGAGGYASYNVEFGSNNELIHTQAYNNSYASVNIFDDIPSTDVSASNSYSAARSYLYINGVPDLRGGENGGSTPNLEYVSKSSNGDIAFGFQNTDAKLTLLSEPKGAGTVNQNSVVAYIASDYNTGWMHGDIKGAFLSDTDTTDSNADTLNSGNAFDGTFATSTGWVTNSDWSISGGVATCNGNDSGRYIYPTTDRWSYRRSVVVEITVTAYTSGTLSVSYGTGAATSGTNMTATGTYKFVNVTTGNDLIYIRSDSFVGSIDNVKIYYAEEDRTGNKKGLITYGTITKSAVATGAELVGYSGFSASNYLQQPTYNSDFLFGTDDFCITGWVNNTVPSNSVYEDIITFGNVGIVGYSNMEPGTWFIQMNKDYGFNMYYKTSTGTEASGWSNFSASGNFQKYSLNGLGEWYKITIVKTGGRIYSYTNDDLLGSNYVTGSFTTSSNLSDMKLTIGYEGGNSYGPYIALYSKLALWRISRSAPSPEQVSKMYHDEKVLFQENAACTLYGSSNAVTGLAHDDSTDTLHVGTSAGRSEFQGLCRINNTTTAVTTAISASNGLVAEQ